MVYWLRLKKDGYGTWEEVKSMNSREVLQALAYEAFCSDYESAFTKLNKGG